MFPALNLGFDGGSVLSSYVLLERAECAGGDAHALAVDADNLKVDVLTTTRGDVGVAAGVAENSTFSAQLTDT